MRSPPRWQAALVLCLVSLALGACGGSSHSSSTVVSPSTTTTGQPAQTTVTVTATATSSTANTATTAPTGPSTCQTAHVSLSLLSAQGAAGTSYTTYALTNIGSTPCTMIGYPGVSILDANGAIVQHPATRGAATPAPVKLVTLEPGRHAQFLLNSTDVIPSPGCPASYTGATLQVFPPNQRAALRLPHTGEFCNLRVGPVEAG